MKNIIQARYFNRRQTTVLPLTWGVLHGLNDFAAAFLLTAFHVQNSGSGTFTWYALYAVLAFGGQLPIGLFLDRLQTQSTVGYLVILLLFAAILIAPVSLEMAIILSGLSSAGIHVVGGSVCLQLKENKSGPLGIFAAPGVLGLTLGILAGSFFAISWFTFFSLPVAICLAVVYLSGFPKLFSKRQSPENKLKKFDWLIVVLLLVMSLRSLVFDILNHFSSGLTEGFLVVGLCAFLGKLVGGFIADRFGSKIMVYISLALAIIFLQASQGNIYLLGLGIICLQSSVPVFLMLLRQQLPQFSATVSALGLGTTIAIGGLPLFIMKPKLLVSAWFNSGIIWLAVLMAIAAVLFYTWKILSHKNSRSVTSS